MEITDFINGKVTYDQFGGQVLWINRPDGTMQMLSDIRGWGAIQNMFIRPDSKIDLIGASKFQDKLGQFIADAINEKIDKDFNHLNNK